MQYQVAALSPPFWRAYTQIRRAQDWCSALFGLQPFFAAALGFTETALVPGISAAGATPEQRRFTAVADAEVLLTGASTRLPTSPEGSPSPVVISRAVLKGLQIPFQLFDCGLPEAVVGVEKVPGGGIAQCLSTSQAQSRPQVEALFQQGLEWGIRLAEAGDYLVVGECVAGGTTTALAVLLGLGIPAAGMVNSSHPVCNHQQKKQLVQQGLDRLPSSIDGLGVVAAVGDPMQPFVAGVALQASRRVPVLLAGGTQMLAVYALLRRLAFEEDIDWNPEQVVVGTTRWVAEDPTGNTVALAQLLDRVPLLATRLSLRGSRFPSLQAYEQGFVKEGIGAGGLAITASLKADWQQEEMVEAIDTTYSLLLPGLH